MSVEAYILCKVSSGMEKQVAKKIAELNEVSTSSITYGEYDIVAKVTLSDLHQLEDFIADKLRNVPNVILTSTMIIAQEFRGKNNRGAK